MMGPHAARVDRVLRELVDGHGLGYFFVGGSGGLALRDIRGNGDLDLGVPTADWFRLVDRYGWTVVLPDREDARRRCDPPIARRMVELASGAEVQVDAWFSWRWRGFHETEWNDFNLVFREGIELVHGWPCLALQHLLRMKVDAVQNGYDDDTVRPKDVADIALIVDYLRHERATLAGAA
jgi:hypothetical protein